MIQLKIPIVIVDLIMALGVIFIPLLTIIGAIEHNWIGYWIVFGIFYGMYWLSSYLLVKRSKQNELAQLLSKGKKAKGRYEKDDNDY